MDLVSTCNMVLPVSIFLEPQADRKGAELGKAGATSSGERLDLQSTDACLFVKKAKK